MNAVAQSLGTDQQAAGAAALASALAAGMPMDQALASAIQTQSAAQAQLVQAQVAVDPRMTALTSGHPPDGCLDLSLQGCEAGPLLRSQLDRATVPIVQPGLAAIALGKVPGNFESDPILRRLLVRGPRQEVSVSTRAEEPVGQAGLLLRLAQGVATDADLARLGGGAELPGFAADFLRELAAGRSIDVAAANARATAAGLARDLASLPATAPSAPVKTAIP